MTIPSTPRKAGPFLGNGAATSFPFAFKVFAAADVKVVIADSNGVETTLVLDSDYSVTLNPNQDTSPGGVVTYPLSGSPLPSGSVLLIIGNTSYDQPLDLPSGGNFSPLALENQLDRTTMQIQQLREEMDRTAKLPPTSSESVEDLVYDLRRIADSADNLDTVANNIAAVVTVANDLNEPVSEIDTVATNIANVNAVGSNIAAVVTVANDLNEPVSEIDTVATNIANVNAVGSNIANVNTVATNIANVNTVATNIANINAVGSNIADVQTVAANVADVTNFADVYQGGKPSDPTVRNDGSALRPGDLYFNTTTGRLRVFGGTVWQEGNAGSITVERFSGNGSQTAFTLNTAPGDENNTQVYVSGVYQQKNTYSISGTTLTFAAAPPAGTNNIEVVVMHVLPLGTTDASLTNYLPAGTGAATRTVQDKLREFVSIKDFGAVGDGVTDDTAAIQAALNYVNSKGGGVVFIPPGRYRKGDAPGSQLIMYSNTTLLGVGDSSIIFFDDRDTVPRSGNDLLRVNNVSNIVFDSFKIEGTALTYTNETNHKQCLGGSVIDGLRMVNVTIEKVRYMATSFSYAKNVYMAGNRLDYVVRDGLRVTNSENVIITGNTLRRVADDAIAVSSIDDATTPGSGIVVTNNTLEACQGIKALGGKIVTIRGNVLRRSLRSPIIVELPNSGIAGNTPQFAVDVSDNIITDSFGNLGTNCAIQISQMLARSDGGLVTFPGVNSAPFAYNYLNDIGNGTQVVIGQFGIRVCNNIIARTLPDGVNYSDWGYGQFFDRNTAGFLSDPLITSSAFQIHGIRIIAPATALQIHGNNISGTGTGYNAVVFGITGSTNRQDYASVSVQGNTFFDCPGIGVGCMSLGSGSGAKQVVIQNNTFDLDPYFRAATHNTDNTWTSTTGVIGVQAVNTTGWLVGGNVFKNCGSTGLSPSVVTEVSPNIVYADFVGSSDNAGNKGVRQLPSAAANIIVPIDGDPTSPTFGQIENVVAVRSSSMPTTGRYVAGHRVMQNVPVVVGTAGSQYVVTGWLRVTTGSGHVLNTDWVEMRTFTGT